MRADPSFGSRRDGGGRLLTGRTIAPLSRVPQNPRGGDNRAAVGRHGMRRIGNDLSPYVRRVAVSLNILYWPFELDEVFVFKDPAVVRRYNPLVRIPVLVLDDGSNLFESAAILDEIDRLSGTETVSDAKPRPATASRCTDDRNRRGVRGEGSVVLLRRSRATREEAAHTLDRAQRQAGPRWLRTIGRDRSQGRPRGLDCWDASHQPGRRDEPSPTPSPARCGQGWIWRDDFPGYRTLPSAARPYQRS